MMSEERAVEELQNADGALDRLGAFESIDARPIDVALFRLLHDISLSLGFINENLGEMLDVIEKKEGKDV